MLTNRLSLRCGSPDINEKTDEHPSSFRTNSLLKAGSCLDRHGTTNIESRRHNQLQQHMSGMSSFQATSTAQETKRQMGHLETSPHTSIQGSWSGRMRYSRKSAHMAYRKDVRAFHRLDVDLNEMYVAF